MDQKSTLLSWLILMCSWPALTMHPLKTSPNHVSTDLTLQCQTYLNDLEKFSDCFLASIVDVSGHLKLCKATAKNLLQLVHNNNQDSDKFLTMLATIPSKFVRDQAFKNSCESILLPPKSLNAYDTTMFLALQCASYWQSLEGCTYCKFWRMLPKSAHPKASMQQAQQAFIEDLGMILLSAHSHKLIDFKEQIYKVTFKDKRGQAFKNSCLAYLSSIHIIDGPWQINVIENNDDIALAKDCGEDSCRHLGFSKECYFSAQACEFTPCALCGQILETSY